MKRRALIITLLMVLIYPNFNVISQEQFKANIWVDKGCGSTYKLGELIRISFNVSKSAYVTIKDDYSGGYRILYRGYVNGSVIYNFTTRASSPASTIPVYRRITIRAQDQEGRITSDSCRIAVVIVEKPDMAVGRIRVMRLAVFPTDIIVMAEIINLGKGNTGSFTVGLYVDGKLAATRRIGNILPTLYTGVTFHISLPYYRRKYLIRIVVDINDEIEELNETNNEGVEEVTIRGFLPAIQPTSWISKP